MQIYHRSKAGKLKSRTGLSCKKISSACFALYTLPQPVYQESFEAIVSCGAALLNALNFNTEKSSLASAIVL